MEWRKPNMSLSSHETYLEGSGYGSEIGSPLSGCPTGIASLKSDRSLMKKFEMFVSSSVSSTYERDIIILIDIIQRDKITCSFLILLTPKTGMEDEEKDGN